VSARLRSLVGCVLALVAGVGAGACGSFWGCPELEPFEPAVYEVDRSEERPELVGAIIDATQDDTTISYSLDDGSDWVVTYRRAE
jgi:hypothetical protein